MFQNMINAIQDTWCATFGNVVRLKQQKRRGGERYTDDSPKQPARKESKVGRNDPCPCGSGKKYKKCCGRAEAV